MSDILNAALLVAAQEPDMLACAAADGLLCVIMFAFACEFFARKWPL